MNEGELKKLCTLKGCYYTKQMGTMRINLGDGKYVPATKDVIAALMEKPSFDFHGGFPPPTAINLEGKTQAERDDIVSALLTGHTGALS